MVISHDEQPHTLLGDYVGDLRHQLWIGVADRLQRGGRSISSEIPSYLGIVANRGSLCLDPDLYGALAFFERSG